MRIEPVVIRLVLDTNAAISGLLWGGNSGLLIDAAQRGQIEIASSLPLLAGLYGVLARARFAQQLSRRGLSLNDIFDGYAALAIVVAKAKLCGQFRSHVVYLRAASGGARAE